MGAPVGEIKNKEGSIKRVRRKIATSLRILEIEDYFQTTGSVCVRVGWVGGAAGNPANYPDEARGTCLIGKGSKSEKYHRRRVSIGQGCKWRDTPGARNFRTSVNATISDFYESTAKESKYN